MVVARGGGGGSPYVAVVATVGQNNEPDDIWLPSTGSHNNRLAVSRSQGCKCDIGCHYTRQENNNLTFIDDTALRPLFRKWSNYSVGKVRL